MGAADRGHRFPEGNIIGIDQPEIAQAEVCHGACGCADIQRIARGYENDCEFRGYLPLLTRLMLTRPETRTRVYRGNDAGATIFCHPLPLRAFRNATRSAFCRPVRCRGLICGSRFLFGVPPLS